MSFEYFTTPISRHIWDSKYRYRRDDTVLDQTVEDTWRRVATAIAEAESRPQRRRWARSFYDVLRGFRFLPGGRIQAGAGTEHNVTLFNCFVMGIVPDSMNGIFDALKEGALTMQQGGGVGYDFSTLRPRGTAAHSVGAIASGPVSFMRIWDSMCGTILSTGARRGAMMATLRADHPDIDEFIATKQDSHVLRHFNLSVQVSDDFVRAVRSDDDWALIFPTDTDNPQNSEGDVLMRDWTGRDGEVPCRVVRRVRARELWDRIMRANYDYAEPGVLFVDRINRLNNLHYREHITATNPCGEIPLPPYGACDLGSVNLTAFVRAPFANDAVIDWAALRTTVACAARLLDNVIDVSHFPLQAQEHAARSSRRIGLGVTGLADALIMLGLHYDSDVGRAAAAEIMRAVCHSAYLASVDLAQEKGAFPYFERDAYLEGEFIRSLPGEIRDRIATHGIRNSHLTAIAPTGTISLLANNISSGLEPVYDFQHSRKVLERDGSYTTYQLDDYAYRAWREAAGDDAAPPYQFVNALAVSPQAHLQMQAALQPYVDNAISKTINVPEAYDFGAFKSLYDLAYDQGLKGCTTFRPNPITGQVLAGDTQGTHCCSIEREAD